jgi:DNA-directed RNA polymerase specialized sigma subunit
MGIMSTKNIWMKGTATELNKAQENTQVSDAYNAWKTDPANQANTKALLDELHPTIESALTSYAPQDKDSLRTRARIMAIDAAGTYDPKHSAKLSSYVFNSLKSLNRVKAKRTNIVHIPENVILEQNKINNAKNALTSELGREPTILELSDHTGLSAKRIEYANKRDSQKSSSQFLTEKGDSFFTQQEDPQRIWADYVYHDMDSIDKKVFEWSTGYGGTEKLKKMDIAKKLKISPSAVSQRINKIIHKLEQGYSV